MGTPVIVSYIWRKSRFVKLNEHNVFLCARERKRVGELGWRVIDTIQNKEMPGFVIPWKENWLPNLVLYFSTILFESSLFSGLISYF